MSEEELFWRLVLKKITISFCAARLHALVSQHRSVVCRRTDEGRQRHFGSFSHRLIRARREQWSGKSRPSRTGHAQQKYVAIPWFTSYLGFVQNAARPVGQVQSIYEVNLIVFNSSKPLQLSSLSS